MWTWLNWHCSWWRLLAIAMLIYVMWLLLWSVGWWLFKYTNNQEYSTRMESKAFHCSYRYLINCQLQSRLYTVIISTKRLSQVLWQNFINWMISLPWISGACITPYLTIWRGHTFGPNRDQIWQRQYITSIHGFWSKPAMAEVIGNRISSRQGHRRR